MRGAKIKESTRRIWDLYRQGKQAKEIVAETGYKDTTVQAALNRGRTLGAIEHRKGSTSTKWQLRRYEITAGTVTWILDQLFEDQLEWLISEASELGCETVAELILEKLRDEYEESNRRV